MTIIAATKQNLSKLEAVFTQLGYKIRYEKGNFKTGACLLEHGRVIIVNKFLDLEARITALSEILTNIPIELSNYELDEKQKSFLLGIRQKKLSI